MSRVPSLKVTKVSPDLHCSLHKSVICWEIVARAELQCLGHDGSCGHGAVECSAGRWDMLPLCYNNTGSSGENYKNNVATALILIFR